MNPHRPGDAFADATAPSGRGFIALLEAFRATGGTAPGAIVGRLLEEHQAGTPVSLARRIHSGMAFGFAWRGSLWIPMFQFDANDLALKASAQRVRAALPPLWSGWAVASWFAAPNAQLGGHRPADWLDLAPEAVLRAARALESGAAFLRPPAPPVHRAATHV